ncbi:MAG: hypothetical protein LBQ12_12600 [Deltaproteobacteria bacterium]|jgi:hypothetical protein|nr:hypothetical protein [Deltaproteobacteria bacterium]
MSESITCPGCGAAIAPDHAADELACPKCGTVIPNPEADAPDADAISSMALAADRVAEEAMGRVSAPAVGEGAEAGPGAVPGAEKETAAGPDSEAETASPGSPGEAAGRPFDVPGCLRAAGADSEARSPDPAPSGAAASPGGRAQTEPFAAPHEPFGDAAPNFTGVSGSPSIPPPEPTAATPAGATLAGGPPTGATLTGGQGNPLPADGPEALATSGAEHSSSADGAGAEAAETLPGDEALCERGRQAMERADLPAAEEFFQNAAAANPDSYEAWKGLADCVLHRPAGGVFKGIRMIDFLKADIEPSFVESALDPAERGKRVYLVHEASGAILAGFAPGAAEATRSVSAVILGSSIHRYGGFELGAPELASGKGRGVLADWEGFRVSFSASLEPLRIRLVNAARLAPKGREAELVMEYAYRFLDRPMAMADICAGGPMGAKDRRCFVATEIYGDPGAPEVVALRRFRDNSLMASRAGRALVRAYYALGPAIAGRLAKAPRLKRLARRALDALLRILPE